MRALDKRMFNIGRHFRGNGARMYGSKEDRPIYQGVGRTWKRNRGRDRGGGRGRGKNWRSGFSRETAYNRSEIMYTRKNFCLIIVSRPGDIEISSRGKLWNFSHSSCIGLLHIVTRHGRPTTPECRALGGTLNENSYWPGHSSFSRVALYFFSRERGRTFRD